MSRFAALVVATLLALALPAPARAEVPEALRAVSYDQHLGDPLPLEARFRDEAGRDVKLGDYFGQKPVIFALVYNECPMLCSLVLQGIVGSLRAVSTSAGKDFEVVIVSFDPKDTPAIARKKKDIYVRRYNRPTGEAGFHFLTGDAASIERVTKAVGFRYEWEEKTRQFAHPSGLVVASPKGTISRYLFGNEFSPKDLGLALTEASDGKVGPVANKLLLLCYRYDPKSGTYSANIMAGVRFGGVLTLAGLLVFMASSLRKERKKGGRNGTKPTLGAADGGAP